MTEVVVVDLGGVAARFRPERRLAALASLSSVAPALLQRRLFDSGLDARAEVGQLSTGEVIAAMQAALDDRVPADALIEAWALAFEPDEDVLDCVRSIDARTALLTNNGPMLDMCLAGPLRELASAFGEAICSWHLRACKPDVRAFERAAERLGCRSGRLLLLDDSPANVAAALTCGWQAERVTSADEMRAAICSRYAKLLNRNNRGHRRSP